jgi:hypothetical protein
MMTHNDRCIELRQIDNICHLIRRTANDLVRIAKTAFLDISRSVVNHGNAPSQFGRQASHRFGIEPCSQHEQAWAWFDEGEQNVRHHQSGRRVPLYRPP